MTESLLIEKIPHYDFSGKMPDNNLKERDDRSEILDPLGNSGNTDCLHAHIAFTGGKYKDRPNYPGAEFRIVTKNNNFSPLVPLGVSSIFID